MPTISTNRVTIAATGTTVRGPWEEPVRASLPAMVPQTDPRLELSEQALVVASQNAYPIVARQRNRRDSLGLAAGGAIALVLGCATFLSLNSGRHPSSAPATGAVTRAQPQSTLPVATAPLPNRPMGMPVPGAPAAPAQQPAPMAGMDHAPGMMTMPGGPSAASPVLVFDGGTAPGSTVLNDP